MPDTELVLITFSADVHTPISRFCAVSGLQLSAGQVRKAEEEPVLAFRGQLKRSGLCPGPALRAVSSSVLPPGLCQPEQSSTWPPHWSALIPLSLLDSKTDARPTGLLQPGCTAESPGELENRPSGPGRWCGLAWSRVLLPPHGQG